MTKEMTMESHAQALASDKLVLIDFYADWCVPCQSMGKILQEVSTEMEGKVDIYKANTEDLDDLCMEYNIRNLPTIIFLRKGKIVKRMTGTMPKDKFVEVINSLL